MHFVLQEKDSEPGDYVVRARGAWFGNRSISAEVELEPGVYEVLPKIEAKRDAGSPDVHEVVTKVAERNPQKLRQIGLNYDLANARGLDQLTEEEQLLAKKKKKEAAEKKRKEDEAAEKEKAAFEVWKREEKEEYETWKEKKRMEQKTPGERTGPRHVVADSTAPMATDVSSGVAERGELESVTPVVESDTTATVDDVTAGQGNPESGPPTVEGQLGNRAEAARPDDADPPSDEDPELRSRVLPRNLDLRGYPPSPRDYPRPPNMYRPIPRGYYRDEPVPGPGPRNQPPIDDRPKPWNAVCVLGLRVYSQDSSVSIKLVKPKDAEEGAILDVGGDTAAGATM